MAQEKAPKDKKTFIKKACVFPFNPNFQFRLNNGGSVAALEEPQDVHSKQAAAATDGMPGCCVAEADLCCDVTEIAATDFEDTTNSMGMGKCTFAGVPPLF